MMSRGLALALDVKDPLAPLRSQFSLPDGVIYLDGNSLGALPVAAPARAARTVEEEWGQGLIRSWNAAGWVDLPQRVGAKIGRLIGAGPDETLAGDSTSVNLYKVLSTALEMIKADGGTERRVIATERDTFPTDLYIAASLARQYDCQLQLLETEEIADQFGSSLAVLLLSHVNYRTGRLHDMTALTRAGHECGALVVWDLAHSAGALPVDLNNADADFAVGCGYKYLNGSPGAPAYLWANRRHLARMERDAMVQPLSGWCGHAAPFDFSPHYSPASDISQFACGTPPVLSFGMLDVGVDTVLAAEPLGGMTALRRKSLALTGLFMSLVEERCGDLDVSVITPGDEDERGSQVSLYRADGAYAVVQALIARGVIGDFREPGIMRFGFTPLYTRFVDVWDAVEHLHSVLESEEWRHERFHRRAVVT